MIFFIIALIICSLAFGIRGKRDGCPMFYTILGAAIGIAVGLIGILFADYAIADVKKIPIETQTYDFLIPIQENYYVTKTKDTTCFYTIDGYQEINNDDITIIPTDSIENAKIEKKTGAFANSLARFLFPQTTITHYYISIPTESTIHTYIGGIK